jgi:hypothetical protein
VITNLGCELVALKKTAATIAAKTDAEHFTVGDRRTRRLFPDLSRVSRAAHHGTKTERIVRRLTLGLGADPSAKKFPSRTNDGWRSKNPVISFEVISNALFADRLRELLRVSSTKVVASYCDPAIS